MKKENRIGFSYFSTNKFECMDCLLSDFESYSTCLDLEDRNYGAWVYDEDIPNFDEDYWASCVCEKCGGHL